MKPTTARMQITIVGDFEAEALERHFRDYLGTIAPRAEPLALPHAPIEFTRDMPLPQRHQVRLPPQRTSRAAPTAASCQ